MSSMPLASFADPAPASRRHASTAATRPDSPSGFTVSWARHDDEVRAAQRLRHQVFVTELGARLTLPRGAPAGHDIDVFDPYCEHLLVRSLRTEDEEPGTVEGTYRVLTPAAAKRIGGLYSDTEFDLTRLRALRPKMVELGRSCVHPDWRRGGVILALWGALTAFMQRNRLDTMIGCASIGMHDGGHLAASLWEQLRHSHLAPVERQVSPRLSLPIGDLQRDLCVDAPALIRGYLRCGAQVLGPPAWDPDFNTADLPLMMRMEDMPQRYRRHFLGA